MSDKKLIAKLISLKPTDSPGRDVYATDLGWATLHERGQGDETLYEYPRLLSVLTAAGYDKFGRETGNQETDGTKDAGKPTDAEDATKGNGDDSDVDSGSQDADDRGTTEDIPGAETEEDGLVDEDDVESTEPEDKSFSRESLSTLKMNELRKIGKELGVKDIDKEKLIDKILEAQ